jgi:hypothetical protein
LKALVESHAGGLVARAHHALADDRREVAVFELDGLESALPEFQGVGEQLRVADDKLLPDPLGDVAPPVARPDRAQRSRTTTTSPAGEPSVSMSTRA